MRNLEIASGKSSRQGISSNKVATHVYWPAAVARAASRAIQAATTSLDLGSDNYRSRRFSAARTTARASVPPVVRATYSPLIARSHSFANAIGSSSASQSAAAPGPPRTNNSQGRGSGGGDGATVDAISLASWQSQTAAAAGGGGGGGGGAEVSGPGRPRPLLARVRACRTLDQLVSLYGTAQREAEAQARWRAQRAGAAAAAAGLAGGAAAGLGATAVWVFLGAAWELLAAWRRRWQAGRRGAKGREATAMRAQLSSLLRDACGVVLWAERLAPAKACLLLTLLVAAGRYPGSEQHLGLLVEDSLNSLEAYSSSQVALAASSFARLRYYPGNGWVETMLEATSGQLRSWRPGELAFLLWALAKWKATPPAAWLQEYYAAFEACGERVSERDLSLVAWALGMSAAGRGGVRPPPSLTNHIMLEVQVRLPTLSGQALAHVAWGLCCCDVKPPGFWLREFHEASKATLPYATSGLTFSNLLWAFAAWQEERHPGEAWLDEADKQCARWLPSLDARSLAVLLLALSDLGHTPPVQWVGLALEAAHRNLPATDPASAVAVLWAVSRFERQRAAAAAAAVQPPPARRRRLSSLSPEDVLLLADEVGLGFGNGFGASADGSLGVNVGRGGAAGTPPHLRPARKWLVRYTPLVKDVAMAAAGIIPSAPPATTPASPAAAFPATAAAAAVGAAGGSGGGSGGYTFEGLDANQMLDLVVALADLYVYPGDEWMAAHEARMASLAGGVVMSGPGARPPGSGAGSGLTPFQWQLLLGAYGALDDTWEGYAAPKAGEAY